jgi:hypothetical protein
MHPMFTFFLVVFGSLVVVGAVVAFYMLRRAPEASQDETGFHARDDGPVTGASREAARKKKRHKSGPARPASEHLRFHGA